MLSWLKTSNGAPDRALVCHLSFVTSNAFSPQPTSSQHHPSYRMYKLAEANWIYDRGQNYVRTWPVFPPILACLFLWLSVWLRAEICCVGPFAAQLAIYPPRAFTCRNDSFANDLMANGRKQSFIFSNNLATNKPSRPQRAFKPVLCHHSQRLLPTQSKG